MFRREVFAEYMREAVSEGMKYIEDFMIKCMVFDKRRIKFFDRNVIFYEFGAGISTVQKKNAIAKRISEAMTYDIYFNNKMLLKRCKTSPSKFSERLEALIKPEVEAGTKWEARQKLKAKLGIAAIPLVLLWNVYKWIKASVFNKGKKEKDNFIMTDINVPTDFANLCINRE